MRKNMKVSSVSARAGVGWPSRAMQLLLCGKLPAPNQCGAIEICTRRPMSHERQAQFANRLQQVKALRRHLAGAGQYERAYRADLLIQRLYERWADEMFEAARTN